MLQLGSVLIGEHLVSGAPHAQQRHVFHHHHDARDGHLLVAPGLGLLLIGAQDAFPVALLHGALHADFLVEIRVAIPHTVEPYGVSGQQQGGQQRGDAAAFDFFSQQRQRERQKEAERQSVVGDVVGPEVGLLSVAVGGQGGAPHILEHRLAVHRAVIDEGPDDDGGGCAGQLRQTAAGEPCGHEAPGARKGVGDECRQRRCGGAQPPVARQTLHAEGQRRSDGGAQRGHEEQARHLHVVDPVAVLRDGARQRHCGQQAEQLVPSFKAEEPLGADGRRGPQQQ